MYFCLILFFYFMQILYTYFLNTVKSDYILLIYVFNFLFWRVRLFFYFFSLFISRNVLLLVKFSFFFLNRDLLYFQSIPIKGGCFFKHKNSLRVFCLFLFNICRKIWPSIFLGLSTMFYFISSTSPHVF